MTMARNFGSERVVRQLMFLKLGYLNELNIIHERTSRSGGNTQRMSGPSIRSLFSAIMNSVMLATQPAAAGIGKPLNSLPAPGMFAAAMQLNRASRIAPQMR